MRWLTAWIGSVVMLCVAAATACADITVDSIGDASGVDGHCTLREGLAAASDPSTPSADCPGASVSGTTTVKLTDNPRLLGEQIEIPSGAQIAIVGKGRTDTSIAPSGAATARFLLIDSGATVSIAHLTIASFRGPAGAVGSGGVDATTRGGNGLNAGQAGSGGDGGAVLNHGTLNVSDIRLIGNTAGVGGAGQVGGSGGKGTDAGGTPGGAGGHGGDGGAGGTGGSGGALANTGTLVVDDAVFLSNSAGAGGAGGTGGTGGAGGPVVPASNHLGGTGGAGGSGGTNGTGGGGGAIVNSGTLTVTESTFTGDAAGAAGKAGTGGTGGAGADGYAAAPSGTTGGNGGPGGQSGVGAFPGGPGGALFNSGTATLTGVIIHDAQGGAGTQPGPGGRGGEAGFGDTEGTTGAGGTGATGSLGGPGGAIGTFLGTLTISQSALYGDAGDGGRGATGGEAGQSHVDGGRTGTGGAVQPWGLPGAGGHGGDGGNGGVLSLSGTTTLTNVTIGEGPIHGAGDGGSGGSGAEGHSHPGGHGGDGGNGGSGGAIQGAGVTLTHVTIVSTTVGAFGSQGAGGFGTSNGPAGTSGTQGSVSGIQRLGGPATTVRNSVFSGVTCAGITDGGHNFSETDATCGPHVDPKISTFTDADVMPVLTLAPDSPAVGAVPATGANCALTDARGTPRPQGAACDSGAFELAPAPVCPDFTIHSEYNSGTNVEPVCSHSSTRPDAGANATIALITDPSHGFALPVTDPGPILSYSPNPGFVGADSLTFKVTDADGTSNVATATIITDPPAAPKITGSTPASPSAGANPHIFGDPTASAFTVRLYASADCSGTAVATGNASSFRDPGYAVQVAENATTNFTADYETTDSVISPCSAPFAYTHDTLPPDTFIDGGPSGTIADARPVFTFHASEAATFECSLDQGTAAFRACSGDGTDQPALPLGFGDYTFRVRARDVLGNIDATPATSAFTVASASPTPTPTVPKRPDTILVKHPKAKVKVASKRKKAKARFTFRSSPKGATFTCKLDKKKAKRCKSGVKYKVKRGKHVFTVTARNAVGADLTPAKFRWKVVVKKKR